MTIQVHPTHYNENYDTKERFCSYWCQIQEITSAKPHSILEIGIGNRFVTDYMRKKGFKITSLDIDKRLMPDLAASILNIPFKDRSFDVVSCYEVLEHLPYNQFVTALSEIKRISIKSVILSIPDSSLVYRFYFQIPKLGEFKSILPLPKLRPKKHLFDGQHYWEIDKQGYPLKKVFQDIESVGFRIERTYRSFEMPYHRFFVLIAR